MGELQETDERTYERTGRELITALASGEFDPDRFEFAEEMHDPTELPTAWEKLTGVFGSFQSVESTEYHHESGETHVRFSLSSAEFRAEVEFDDDGAIVDVPMKKCDNGGTLSTLADVGRVLRHVVGKRLGRPGDEADSPPSAPGPDRAEWVVRKFFDEEYRTVNEQLTGEMAENLTPDQLSKLSEKALSGRIGEYRGIDSVEYDRTEQEASVSIDCTGTATKAKVQFRDDGAVSGLLITRANGGIGDDVNTEDGYEPPAYADPSAFDEREVAFESEAYELGATMTVPDVDGSVPGVVLVPGSGPNDRDAGDGPNRPFRDLAWGLASDGVAVLRYDERRYATEWEYEAGRTPEDETVHDAVAAAEELGTATDVDRDELFVLGHSFGGSLAPLIADEVDGIAGVVSMAGTPRHAITVILDQVEYLATVEDSYSRADKEEFREVTEARERILSGDLAEGEWVVDHPASYWRFWTEYDPAEAILDTGVPAYVAHFGRDFQVTTADLTVWRRRLGGCDRVSIERYPGLNHLGIPSAGQRSPAEYGDPGDVSRELVDDLAEWIDRTT